jgi:hypothetical protein
MWPEMNAKSTYTAPRKTGQPKFPVAYVITLPRHLCLVYSKHTSYRRPCYIHKALRLLEDCPRGVTVSSTVLLERLRRSS